MMAVKFKVHGLLKRTLLNVVLYIAFYISVVNAAKLTVPRILLPYNTGIPTNYTLEVKEGGCYKWSSSRYDLVSVTPLPSEREKITCTTKALVSSVSRFPERDNAIILAEDEKSGQILRCDVVVDSLSVIEIVTTTRVLYLEDAPEAFEVVAKNDKGDTFSSLAGVAFQWSLDNDASTNDVHGVLRFLKFSDSVYKTPSSIEYWEKKNLHGSMILMEGSKTGSAKVTVKPLDPVYKHVKSYEVSLVIVANLNLKPAHIYLLPGTSIKFHLELIKQGKAFAISLPSDQYYLEVVDKSVAALDTASSTVTALRYGSTSIAVKDRYITDREVLYLPSSAIHVAIPSYLTFAISPGDKWSLEEKKTYYISVNIYDRNSHPIHITENVRVGIKFPSKYFKVNWSSANGTYQEVYTLIPGTCQITALIIGVSNKNDVLTKIEHVVSATQDIIIYESIKVLPAFTLLPWDPITKPIYSIYLKATGGTGSFNWLCGDTMLGSVNAVYHDEQSRARLVVNGRGKFLVHATDAHISTFTGAAEISVQPVVEMKVFRSEVEVELNKSLILPLAMYGHNPGSTEKILFSNCSEVPILVEIDEVQRFTHIEDNVLPVQPNACRNIHLQCDALGFNRVLFRIKEDTSIKTTAIVSCFRKLQVIYPSKEAVLGIGSSITLIFEGGPKSWPLCKSHYVDVFTNNTFADVSALKNESDTSDIHKVRTFCKGLGEETISLKVGNNPCVTNPNPASNEAQVRVVCATPESLVMIPMLPSLPGRKCPISSNNLIAVQNSQDFEIELLVKDSSGREFHNVSSFDIRWYISDASLAYMQSTKGVKVKLVKVHNIKVKSKNFQIIHPYGYDGALTISASITGYKQEVLENNDLSFEDKYIPVLNSSLSFVLVEEAEVQPKVVSVFNSPSNKVFLNITKGSGHFYVETSNENKAQVVYKESTRQVEITPLDTGTFTITLFDLCLGKRYESVAQVQIYGISAVIVDVLDKVELGKSVVASVEILNEERQRIPSSMFSLMNLQPVVLQNIISLRLASAPESHPFQALYTVNGLSLGQTSFQLVTNANVFKGKQYSSDVHHIQVFPPLRLSPHHITLIIGATFQVLCSGGPEPQTGIEYVVDDKELAAVSVAGIIEAKKLGETTLIAKSVGYDKKGNSIIYSQDKATINCITLKEVKVHSPLSRMLAGTEMPLYAMGLNEQETPFTFGTASPAVKLKWSVSNDKVASLENVYGKMGLHEASENNFRVRLKAHQDGLVAVHLDAILPKESSLSFFSSPQVLSGEIQIQVFKRLQLTNPEVEDGVILLSPNAQLKLKCNRLGPAKVSYAIQQPEKSLQAPVVTVDQQGILAASSKIGAAILLVTATEEFGLIQSLTVIVKVSEIAYMMATPTANIRTQDWQLTTLPIGFTIPFVVTYHNNIGEIFDAVRSQMKFRASRYNLARISFGSQNNTLSVQVVKPGYTVLKIWDEESPIPPDYIKLVAGPAIDPSEAHFTVGDVICFGSALLTQEGHSGIWSSDSSILSIHSTSGGAVALSPGITTVTYSLLSGYSTATQVTIQAAAYISIVTTSIHHVSNVPREKPYKIPIIIQSNETTRVNNVVGRNCTYATEGSLHLPFVQPPFMCELNFISSSMDINVNDIFQSSGGFDIDKGMYYCSIEPVNKVSASDISIVEGQLSLTVHLQSGDHLSSLTQQHLLTFLPAFAVQQEEIIFSDRQYTSHVTISATPSVQRCIVVIPSDPTILQVKSPKPSSSFPASISFPIELVSVPSMWNGEIMPLHVEINCPVTKQHVKLQVRIKKMEMTIDGGGYCPPPALSPAATSDYMMYDWYWMMTVMITVLAIIIVFYFCRWLTTSRRGVVTTQDVFLNRSNGSQHSHSFSSPRSSFSSPYTPSHDPDNLSRPLRMCSLDPSPQSLQRRRTDNVFK